MAVEIWRPNPEVAADFVPTLAKFGAASELAEWALQYVNTHSGRCLWDAQFLVRTFPMRHCLNIGGAPFLFEFLLQRQKQDVDITTLDLDPSRFPGVEAALGIRLVRGDIESTDCVISEEFECIVLAEVLEHLRIDLIGTLTRIRDLLTPNGILYLTTPNGLGFAALRNHWLRGRTGPCLVSEWEKLGRLGHMGHVREYSSLEVEELLVHCGFDVERRLFRAQATHWWPLRDGLLAMRPPLAHELVIVAHKRTRAR